MKAVRVNQDNELRGAAESVDNPLWVLHKITNDSHNFDLVSHNLYNIFSICFILAAMSFHTGPNKYALIDLIFFPVRISCPPTSWPSVTTAVTGQRCTMATLNGRVEVKQRITAC